MDNQHRKIAGYRELGQDDIDLMNRIKEAGSRLLDLQDELAVRLKSAGAAKAEAARSSAAAAGWPVESHTSDECAELRRFTAAEPHRWAAIGKTDIQTGVMALVRAVAQPAVG